MNGWILWTFAGSCCDTYGSFPIFEAHKGYDSASECEEAMKLFITEFRMKEKEKPSFHFCNVSQDKAIAQCWPVGHDPNNPRYKAYK